MAKRLSGALLLLLAATIVLTWPQATVIRTQTGAHIDPYFSIWRMAWVSHALVARHTHLFDANIFYPEPRTLAYSDATLLEGLIAAPFLWAGVNRVLVYNVL